MEDTKSRDEAAGAPDGAGEPTARGETARVLPIAVSGETARVLSIGVTRGSGGSGASRTPPPSPPPLPRVVAWQRTGVDLDMVRALRTAVPLTLYYGRMPLKNVLGEIDEDGKPRIVCIFAARDPESERYLPRKVNDIRVEARDQQEHDALTEQREEELARAMEEAPPPVAPAIGVGVTVHSGGDRVPGTIVRVSPEENCFWFQRDTVVDGGRGISVVNPSAWVSRAVLQPDGVYRDDHDMHRVDVGRRVSQRGRELGEPGKRPLADVVEAVDRLESWLLKTCWAPMTYMAIPSVLERADELLDELATLAERARKEAEQATAVRERLAKLRAGFKRIR